LPQPQLQLYLHLLQSQPQLQLPLPPLQEQLALPFPMPTIFSTKYATAAAMIEYVIMVCIFYNNNPTCQNMNDTIQARQVV